MRAARGQLKSKAYTLIEMVIVVSIVALLLAIVVPGISTMWKQQNESSSETKMKGLLASARVQAIRKGKTGIIFFLDSNKRQQAVFIEPEPVDESAGSDDFGADGKLKVTELMAVNRYRVVPGDMHAFPVPYRVAPGWTVDTNESTGVADWATELENERFPNQADGTSTPCYHRSYFAILFGSTGEMLVDRNVLIHDPDEDNNGKGDMTGLAVVDVDEYYKKGATSESDLDSRAGSEYRLTDMVSLFDGRAANFVSQSMVFVYDDSALEDLTGQERCEYLLEDGVPFFVTRYTGEIIRGARQGEQ